MLRQAKEIEKSDAKAIKALEKAAAKETKALEKTALKKEAKTKAATEAREREDLVETIVNRLSVEVA